MYERRKSQVCTRKRQPQQWRPNNRPLAGMDKRQCDLPQRRALSGEHSSGDPSGAPATSFKNCQGNRRNSDGADCERCGTVTVAREPKTEASNGKPTAAEFGNPRVSATTELSEALSFSRERVQTKLTAYKTA